VPPLNKALKAVVNALAGLHKMQDIPPRPKARRLAAVKCKK
jgi:hypothetical protein